MEEEIGSEGLSDLLTSKWLEPPSSSGLLTPLARCHTASGNGCHRYPGLRVGCHLFFFKCKFSFIKKT